MVADAPYNGQARLSLPGSGCLQRPVRIGLSPGSGGAHPGTCARVGSVLSSMRDPSGGPNLRMRLLAVVVALLLAGPLTVAVVRGAAAAVRLAV